MRWVFGKLSAREEVLREGSWFYSGMRRRVSSYVTTYQGNMLLLLMDYLGCPEYGRSRYIRNNIPIYTALSASAALSI